LPVLLLLQLSSHVSLLDRLFIPGETLLFGIREDDCLGIDTSKVCSIDPGTQESIEILDRRLIVVFPCRKTVNLMSDKRCIKRFGKVERTKTF